MGTPRNDFLPGTIRRDFLEGLTGNDTLLGYGSNDTLIGGADNDSLLGGDGDDQIQGDSGNDVLVGDAGNDILAGDGGNDRLFGGAGRDILNGGVGNDTMNGGDGDDIYYVDSAFDIVRENTNDAIGGRDSVYASVTYSLMPGTAGNQGYGIENLSLVGSTNINGFGNSNDNVLTGNWGHNQLMGFGGSDTLNGGFGGNDTLLGGSGDDVYFVNNSGDLVKEDFEGASGGVDHVFASDSYSLLPGTDGAQGYGIENLTLTGSSNSSGIANSGHNRMTGNTGNNYLAGQLGNDTLTGGGGSDTMDGGYGDDTYFVDSSDDELREGGGDLLLSAIGGHDKVYASVHYSIDEGSPANLGKLALEDLTLTGVGNLNGIGNSSHNTITGNLGNNILRGNAGNDTMYGAGGNDMLYGESGADLLSGESGDDILIGGAGNDTLSGGGGNDRYRFLFLSEKVDSISDFGTALGNRDYVEVKASSFGASSLSQFSFNPATLALSFLNTPFTTINNQNFQISTDLKLI